MILDSKAKIAVALHVAMVVGTEVVVKPTVLASALIISIPKWLELSVNVEIRTAFTPAGAGIIRHDMTLQQTVISYDVRMIVLDMGSAGFLVVLAI